MRRFLILFLMPWFCALGVFAQVDIYGQSSVEIVAPLSVTEIKVMDFGKIIPGPLTQNVRIYEDGAIRLNQHQLFPGSTMERGEFLIKGFPNTSVSISVADTSNDLTGPGVAIRFRRPVVSDSSVILDASGEAIVYTGGRARVRNDQAPGVYSGVACYTITVNY